MITSLVGDRARVALCPFSISLAIWIIDVREQGEEYGRNEART